MFSALLNNATNQTILPLVNVPALPLQQQGISSASLGSLPPLQSKFHSNDANISDDLQHPQTLIIKSHLPPELFLLIIQHLPLRHILQYRTLSHHMNHLIRLHVRETWGVCEWGMREDLNWEGQTMGEWITEVEGGGHSQQCTSPSSPRNTLSTLNTRLDAHFNLVQCHMRNHKFLHSEPSAKSLSIQYPSSKSLVRHTNILNMNYVPPATNLQQSTHPNVHWTKQERRCLKKMQEGFWVISAMEGSNAYVGTATEREVRTALGKRRVLQPKWFERRNAILFDADVCGGLNLGVASPDSRTTSPESSPATSPRGTHSSILSSSPPDSTKLLIGHGMHPDSKAKQLTSSMFSMKLVAAGNDKNLVLFNLSTGRIQSVLQGHRESIYACKTLNERKVVSADTGGMLCLWDIEKAKLVQSIDNAHSAAIYGVEVEKNQCALTHSKDGFIKLWDFRSGSRLNTKPVLQLSIPMSETITVGIPTAAPATRAPVYDVDMFLTSIVAADREGTVAYWDVRNSTTDPCHIWKPVSMQENCMIAGVSVDRGKVAVLTLSVASENGDTVHVYETLTAAFAEVSRWSEKSYSRVGEKILLRKGDAHQQYLMEMSSYGEILVPHKNGNLKVITL